MDEDGTLLKSLPMSAELAEVIEQQSGSSRKSMVGKLDRMTSWRTLLTSL